MPVSANAEAAQAFGLAGTLGNEKVSLRLVTKDRVPAVLEKSLTVIAN